MHIRIICSVCINENIRGNGDIDRDSLQDCEFTNKNIYKITCKRGHKTVNILQNPQFEVLFEIGINAMSDKYYREAISSFTSSLELFYDFFLSIACKESEIEPSVYKEAIERCNRSEKKQGAFTFLYLLMFKKHSERISRTKVTFRNDVIHNGKIPTYEEALKYGQAVFNLITGIITELNEKYSQAVLGQFLEDYQSKKNEELKKNDELKGLKVYSITTNLTIGTLNDSPYVDIHDSIQATKELSASLQQPE